MEGIIADSGLLCSRKNAEKGVDLGLASKAHSCENGLVNTLPSFLLVKQTFPDLRLKDIRESVHGELEAAGFGGTFGT